MVRMVTNRWQPDTCDCIIDFEFDADEPESTRVHTGTVIQKDCPEHSGLGTAQAFFNAISNENSRKNEVQNDIMTNISELVDVNQDGQYEWKNGITFSWYWEGIDNDRIIHIVITGYTLTAQQRTVLQGLADGRYGVGKVVFD
jgi:hypothetical protein